MYLPKDLYDMITVHKTEVIEHTNKSLLEYPIGHMGQNSKQIDIAKYVSKFLIFGAKMSDKCVKSKKKNFVHCPFLQSQAK